MKSLQEKKTYNVANIMYGGQLRVDCISSVKADVNVSSNAILQVAKYFETFRVTKGFKTLLLFSVKYSILGKHTVKVHFIFYR